MEVHLWIAALSEAFDVVLHSALMFIKPMNGLLLRLSFPSVPPLSSYK
jgi:hypothetical protein